MHREERSKGEGCREGGREGEETDREREREGRELGKGGPGMSVLKNDLCMGVCVHASAATHRHTCVCVS